MSKTNLDKTEIFELVKNILIKKQQINLPINSDTYLDKVTKNSLLMSSIEIIDFIVEIEKFFGIIVDISERFNTIEDTVNSIYNHLNEEK